MCSDEPVKSARVLAPLLASLAFACADNTEPVALYVAAIDFTSAPDLDNRYDFEVSGETFEDPHLVVSDRVFAVEDEAPRVDVDDGRRLLADFDEPAPYLRSTPMRLLVSFGATALSGVRAADVSVQGALRSDTSPSRAAVPVLVAEASTDFAAPLELITDVLPARVDLYVLELAWTLIPTECDGACGPAVDLVTRHFVPTTWRAPIDEAPRYRRAIMWSSRFAAGEWPDAGPGDEGSRASELAIAHAMLDGFATLNDEVGKSYGAFPRPAYDGEVDGVDVWLDFPRSACGELKHGLMAMIEYQGVDAKWGVLEFLDPRSDHFSMYVTYEVKALGREPMVWYQTNHAFVTVNDEVFDPTYNGHAASFADYEDQLFEQFCYGEDEPCQWASDWCNKPPKDGARCIDNPPGHDPELGMTYYDGHSYR